MAGFNYDHLERINQISTLLESSYKKGFPIIKEIIQNANDGGATKLDFGWTKGLETAEHPLLRTPALFFVNNGNFKESDRKAIKSYGIDANAGEGDKIGKFGLGQKSVFHFCEAFFYIASSKEISDVCGDFINPWQPPGGGEKDEDRPDWGELSESDRNNLKSFLQNKKLIETENPDYFLLWIPLRQKASDNRCICANYYDDYQSIRNSFPDDMEKRIGLTLPLLRHLRSVRFFVEEQGVFQEKFHVRLDDSDSAKRFQYPKKAETSDNQQSLEVNLKVYEGDLSGEIVLGTDDKNISFSGKESILDAHEFSILLPPQELSGIDFWENLRESDLWSKRSYFNKLGKSDREPDKSIPHCAVIFTKHPTTDRAKLTLQWAVFLPLASNDDKSSDNQNYKEVFEEIDLNCSGNMNFTVFLHGYFFIDAGRQYISKMSEIRNGTIQPKTPEKPDEMVSQWNYLLATKGTLRLFLPSLEGFCKTLNTEDISKLCDGISRSQLFKSQAYKNSVCDKHQWVCRIKPSGSQWELIGVNETVRSIPNIPSTSSIWDAFPKLREYADRYCLIDIDKPNLLREDVPQWQAQDLAGLLDLLADPDLVLLDVEENYDFLLSVFRLVDNPHALREMIDNHIPFVRGSSARGNNSILKLYSLNQLEPYLNQGRIFLNCSNNRWAEPLQMALGNHEEIILLDDRIAQIIYGDRIQKCDRNACFNILSQQSVVLAQPESRMNLLRSLIG